MIRNYARVLSRRTYSSTAGTGAAARIIKVDNPYDGSIYCEVAQHSDEEALAIVERARKCSLTWRETPLVQRQELCRAIMDQFLNESEKIAADITGQMGKPLQQGRNEINGLRERGFKMIELAETALADEILPEKEGFFRKIAKEPVGTVFTIAPWNYPLMCAINSIIPAVLAGNTCLLKMASRTPLVADWYEKVFKDAGAPVGLCSAVHVSHATADLIIQQPSIGFVSFTGSVSGGHSVHQSIAKKRFIESALELGGKDPAYICNDADLDLAADCLVDGGFYNAGQSCCGMERAYVHESVADAFIEKVIALTQQHRLGDPTNPSTTMGPMATEAGIRDCVSQVADAQAKGAMVVLGGNNIQVNGKGRFFEPTIITGCDHSMTVMKEETFGPVVPIQVVKSDEEAVQLMNDSDYGLTAAVFTSDTDRYLSLAPQIQTGTVFKNRCDYLDPMLPWTGVKDTGKGISLSTHGFRGCTRLKGYHCRL